MGGGGPPRAGEAADAAAPLAGASKGISPPMARNRGDDCHGMSGCTTEHSRGPHTNLRGLEGQSSGIKRAKLWWIR